MIGEGWAWLVSDKVTATSFRNEPTLQQAMEGLVGLTVKCEFLCNVFLPSPASSRLFLHSNGHFYTVLS